MAKKKYSASEVLRMYEKKPTDWKTIKKYYLDWRLEEGLQICCDVDGCQLPNREPVWNGKPLVLTMDHRDGAKRNNTIANLRLACPNCDSQFPTKGGKNKGKVKDLGPNEYLVKSPDGEINVVFGSGGAVLGGEAQVELIKGSKKKKKK